jgi:hypothetical protein
MAWMPGLIAASMQLQHINETLDGRSILNDPAAQARFWSDLELELAGAMNTTVDDVSIIKPNLQRTGSNSTRRALTTVAASFQLAVSGRGAVDKLETLKARLVDPGASPSRQIFRNIQLTDSTLWFGCQAGMVLDTSKGYCAQCPYPEHSPDSIQCIGCPDR